MKYVKMEIYATNYIVSFLNKKEKEKIKEYSPYDEWFHHHAPICDEIIVVEDETQEVYIAAIIERWKKEVKDFLSSNSRCGRGAKIFNIEIEYEIIKRKYCANMTINECMEIMTPEQFFNEFGKFTIDNFRDI